MDRSAAPGGPRIPFVSPARLRAWLGVQGACRPLCRRRRAAIHPRLGIWAKMKRKVRVRKAAMVRHGRCACPFILAKIPILRRSPHAVIREGQNPGSEPTGGPHAAGKTLRSVLHSQSCKRPMRPPRRLARRGARVGRSAMMARRSSCVRRDQEEISSMVRKQPTQMRSAGWIVQSLTQGDCTSSRCQTSSFTSAPRFPYAPCDQGRLAGYSLRRRHRSPLSDAFATYPPRAVPFLPQRWRGVHPRR